MPTQFTKTFKRSLLATVAFAVIVAALRLQVGYQTPRQSAAIPTQLAQLQTVQNAVVAVESMGMTVLDMDQAVDFYSNVLSFKKVSDVEVLGAEYEQLQGLFGVRLRIVKLQLGNELIELTEYLTPKGRPIPIDSRSNDRWFQHIAIALSRLG
jgi:hypothetical protein